MEKNRKPLLAERVEALEAVLLGDPSLREIYHRTLQRIINREDGNTTLERVRNAEGSK